MRVIIQGDYFDCQIIRNRFFLWDTYGSLIVLDLREKISSIVRNQGNHFELHIHLDEISHYMVSRIRISGGIFPLDTAYMGEHLYTATETGLYQRYLQEGKKIELLPRGRPKKLVDICFGDLSVHSNMMAMAGVSDGIFELYNPKIFRVTKSGHEAKEIEKGIYSVKQTRTKQVWYNDHDITGYGVDNQYSLYRYRMNKRIDEQGKRLRDYIRQESVGEDQRRLLPVVYEQTNNVLGGEQIINIQGSAYSFTYLALDNQIGIAGRPRRFIFGLFGMAAESRAELVIVRKDQRIIRKDGPITRSRIVSAFGKKNNMLIIVCGDHVEITDLDGD